MIAIVSDSSAYAEFLQAYPEFAATARLDELRASEYGRLDEQRHVYLDYTGGGLHADSQVRAHAELLTRQVFGNPHSASPTSSGMTDLVEQTRRAVLDWFNAPPGEYTAVFTANATGALKHVGRVVSLRAGRTVAADRRQSQLGERHPRVCVCGRRGGGLRADDVSRAEDRPRASRDVVHERGPGGGQPVCVSRRSRISRA